MVDANLKKGVRQQKVVSELAPLSIASRNFSTLARKIANQAFNTDKKREFKWGMTEIPN